MTLASAIEQVFLDCFYADYRTRLVGGAAEPLYLPSRAGGDAIISYREDFAASALHEVAHWCIAGAERRRQEDYGYWYAPDGRDAAQQRQFETVEVRPQALEWHFAVACGARFQVSADNLDAPQVTAPEPAGTRFAAAVLAQAQRYCSQPLPARAALFRAALARQFGHSGRPRPEAFRLTQDETGVGSGDSERAA